MKFLEGRGLEQGQGEGYQKNEKNCKKEMYKELGTG